MNGEFARWYRTPTFANMVIHSCFETMNVIANSFSNLGFIQGLYLLLVGSVYGPP